MKKFKELNMNEQHREKGRFKPIKPRIVPNVATASPRASSDSADVRLKEDSMDTTTMASPEGNQLRSVYTPASRSFTEKPQKEPMKKYKEVKEESEIDIPKDAPSVEAIAKKHGVSVAEIEKQLKIGMAVEAEHGKNKGSEREIAMDHLNEKPNYYTKLKKYVEETEVNEMLKPKMSALDKWRAGATEREKMHNDIEKNRQADASQGKENMSDAITKLSKSLNKEETEMENTIEEGAVPSTEKTVALRHKSSGKEIRVTQNSIKAYRSLGYHPIKEEAEQIEEGQNKQVEGGDPCWKNYQMVGKKMKNGKEVPNCVPVKEAKDDDVGEMIKDKLKIIINRAQEMHDEIGDAEDMPEWVKSKVTLAQDYISTACDYSCGKEQLGEESEKHPFVAVHAKKGKHETHGSTSYEAAQNAAKHWKMKNTAGIDVYRADKKHVAEEAEQLEEAPVVIKTNKEIGAKVTSIGPGGKETTIKTDPAFERAKQGVSASRIEQQAKKKMQEETVEEATIAGTSGWKKSPGTVTDKSGAKHSPMSRARDLARLALNKKAKSLKPVKEEKEDSRKAEIVKDVVKSAKKKKTESTKVEKFESDPVLSSEIQKQ